MDQNDATDAEELRAAYEAFAAAVETVDDARSWRATDCVGWSVRDLVFHCLTDAQRGLVALHTPRVDVPPDRNAVTYWADWRPTPSSSAGAASGRRFARVVAGMFLHVDQLCESYVETARAAAHAASGADPRQPVATQGHVLTAGDFLRTLTVEATIHHLDMAGSLPDAPGPAELGLVRVRQTLDGLLGRAVPVADWDDATYARKATGRAALTEGERVLLGADAARFPLFS